MVYTITLIKTKTEGLGEPNYEQISTDNIQKNTIQEVKDWVAENYSNVGGGILGNGEGIQQGWLYWFIKIGYYERHYIVVLNETGLLNGENLQ